MPATLLLPWLLLAASATDSGIESSLNIQTYAITGSSSLDLWDHIHQLGPLDAMDGKRHPARTHWHIEQHLLYVRSGASCGVGRSKVSIDTEMTLPVWTDPVHGSEGLRREWDVFVAHLKEHELGHRDNGMQAAVAIRQAIDGVGRAPDCKVLGDRIEAAAATAIAHAHQADIDYDARTGSGRKQGAVLP